VAHLASEHNLPLKVNYSGNWGFHIQLSKSKRCISESDLPAVFVQVSSCYFILEKRGERTLHSEKLHIHDLKLYENTQNWINEIILSFWKNRNSIYHCTKSGKVVRHKETHRTSRRILYYDYFECKSKTFTDSVRVDLLIFHKCKVQTWKQIWEMDALYLI
jgi:hypothetical protein